MTEISEEIVRKVGPCVLLRIGRGEKAPRLTGWQKLTLADMTAQYLASLNDGDNVGVLLGKASSGLCTIDVDDDEQLQRFLSANPKLRHTLISKGARGGNIWMRVKGAYPRSGRIKAANGEPFGEFRADGNQTVIYGRHPSGIDYENNGRSVIEIEFDEVAWPEELSLPWAKHEPERPKDPLEGIIILPSGSLQLYESAKRAFEILAKSETLFIRGERVTKKVKGEDGSLKLDIVSEQEFRSRIEMHGRVMAYRMGPRGEELLSPNARCSADIAKAWLASDARKALPPIASIHNCPILIVDNGSVQILGKGYHRKTGGLLIVGGESPEKMQLHESTAALLSIISEFDFATEADKSRAIASLLTPALKFSELLGAAAHTPLFVVEADDSQAGKGFLLELIQTIYRETPSLLTQRDGGVGGFDESLSQAMIDGRPFIQLDNVRGPINSTYFEAVLTCPLKGTIPARVPYKGEVQVRPERFVFQLTSNGFESTRDLANRSCITRIRKRRGFSFRRYPEGNLLEHVAANQPRYLGAIYCVISQWLEHGKQATDDTRVEGRFRRWAQILDWIVQELFQLPPLMDGHQTAQERAANPALNWLRQVCLAAEAEARLDEELTASDIADICMENTLEIPGVPSDAPETKGLLRIGQIMAKTFKTNQTVDCDGFEIEKTEISQYNQERRRDVTLKKYIIRRSAPKRASCAQ